jgi:hypothetical protein
MNALLEALSTLWCRNQHNQITVPTGSYYTCLECGRQYAVPWAKADELPSGCYTQEGM